MKTMSGIPISEAMIQAEVYHQCRLLGIAVALELSVPHGRLDIAIFNKACTHIMGIMEVKKSDMAKRQTKQCFRYESIGLPFILVTRTGIRDAVKWASTLSGGLSLDEINSMSVPIHLQGSRYKRRRRSDFEWDEDLNIKG